MTENTNATPAPSPAQPELTGGTMYHDQGFAGTPPQGETGPVNSEAFKLAWELWLGLDRTGMDRDAMLREAIKAYVLYAEAFDGRPSLPAVPEEALEAAQRINVFRQSYEDLAEQNGSALKPMSDAEISARFIVGLTGGAK